MDRAFVANELGQVCVRLGIERHPLQVKTQVRVEAPALASGRYVTRQNEKLTVERVR